MLTDSSIMLTALRVSEDAPSVPTDCVRRLVSNLRRAGEPCPADLEGLYWKVGKAYQDLCMAGLLDPDETGRCTLTRRGREVLWDHPTGVDASVLEQFPEYLSYVREYRLPEQEENGRFPFMEPKAGYLEGLAAYHAGRGLEDNPFDADSVAHLEWENGWSEAWEEAKKAE